LNFDVKRLLYEGEVDIEELEMNGIGIMTRADTKGNGRSGRST